MKTINILNVPDFKRPDGSWGKSYSEAAEDHRLSMHTRSSILWNNLKSRCKDGSAQRKNSTSYAGIENHFENYDIFTSWCQTQYGYLNKNRNGTFWSLDKDLLYHGNKVYSPDTCMFIPHDVNCLMMSSDVCRGVYPVGVEPDYQVNKIRYIACCRKRTGSKFIGVYDTPIEAHRGWQEVKISRIMEEADHNKDHIKMCGALLSMATRIQSDYDNGRETKVEWWTDRGLTIH